MNVLGNRKLEVIMRCICLVVLSVLMVIPAAADELIVTPSQDAYTCDCAPSTTNPNGGLYYLYQGPVYGCQVNLYIEWDISSLPEDIEIENAEMWLYCKSITGSVTGGNMIYYPITESWNESNVTYNTMPSYSTTVSQESAWPGVQEWMSIDVTEFVESWYTGTTQNYGLFGHYLETIGNCCAGFYSSNYANENLRPYMVITYGETALESESWGKIKQSDI